MSDEQNPARGFVVAGVVPSSGEAVVATAADLAARYGTGLLCVSVEPDRLAFAVRGGAWRSLSSHGNNPILVDVTQHTDRNSVH